MLLFSPPKGDKWKSALSTLVLLCLAQVFSTDAEAFAGKTPVDASIDFHSFVPFKLVACNCTVIAQSNPRAAQERSQT